MHNQVHPASYFQSLLLTVTYGFCLSLVFTWDKFCVYTLQMTDAGSSSSDSKSPVSIEDDGPTKTSRPRTSKQHTVDSLLTRLGLQVRA